MCQTDSTLTLICVIVSNWVLSIIWQAFYKLYNFFFLYTFYRPNAKTAKIWCFAPTSPFYIIFSDGLSIWTYPFMIIYLNIIKICDLISSKNILGKFYATTAPCFWTMHLLVLLKMILRMFFKKYSVNSDHQMLFLISRINRLYARDYHFYSCTLRCETIFGNWKPFKNDEKWFLYHLKSSFRSLNN